MPSSAAKIINAINLFSFVSVPSCNFHSNMEFFFVKFSYLLEQLLYFKKEDLTEDRETTENYRAFFYLPYYSIRLSGGHSGRQCSASCLHSDCSCR